MSIFSPIPVPFSRPNPALTGDHGDCVIHEAYQSCLDFNRLGYQSFMLLNRTNRMPYTGQECGADAARLIRMLRKERPATNTPGTAHPAAFPWRPETQGTPPQGAPALPNPLLQASPFSCRAALPASPPDCICGRRAICHPLGNTWRTGIIVIIMIRSFALICMNSCFQRMRRRKGR